MSQTGVVPIVRDANEDDLPYITEIFNEAILNSNAIWSEHIVDIANRRSWLHERQKVGFPVLVAQMNGKIYGYASYGPFRQFPGYAHSSELSIYIHKDSRKKGIGKVLLAALIEKARDNNVHVLIAGIESENKASIALHEKLGFKVTGCMPQVGIKFGKWLDLVLMQLIL